MSDSNEQQKPDPPPPPPQPIVRTPAMSGFLEPHQLQSRLAAMGWNEAARDAILVHCVRRLRVPEYRRRSSWPPALPRRK
jgi:hypothetical protein